MIVEKEQVKQDMDWNQRRKGSIQFNKSTLLAVLCSGVLVYIVYRVLFPSEPEVLPIYGKKMPPRRHPDTWKQRYHENFIDIPGEVEELAQKLLISEKFVNVDVKGKTVKIHYKECLQPAVSPKLHVLFLHGKAFTSLTWRDLGTLQLVAAAGHWAVAVDLPGYGNSEKAEVEKDLFMESLISALHMIKPVLISPSMSGTYALPYIMKDPFHAADKLSGFVPVAPVGTGMYTHDKYHKVEIPTMIVYGERDHDLGHASLSDLRTMRNSEIMEIADGGHACYMNYPKEWHKLMYNFLHALKKMNTL